MDFTTIIKMILEKAMDNNQTSSKAFWALIAVVALAVVLFGGAAVITAIGQLVAAVKG